MSMDNEGSDVGMQNPVAGISPPKSNKKLWIFGGLGCFGLIGLVCIGCAVSLFLLSKPTLSFMNENKAIVESSEQVKEIVGSPVTIGAPKVDNSKAPKIIIRSSISGPKASGIYVLEGTIDGVTPVRDAIYLEIDGEKIDLDPDAMFNFEVDDGG